MTISAVQNHVDHCTGEPPIASAPKTVFKPAFPSILSPTGPTKRPERLPELHFSMMKDNVLRKRLADQGLPTGGSRTLMQRRYTEWLTLWNSNCDAKNPRHKSDLRREMDVWERTQGGRAISNMSQAPGSQIRDKDFDGAAWATRHDDSFRELIANARKKPLARTGPMAEVELQPATIGDPILSDLAKHPKAKFGSAADAPKQGLGRSQDIPDPRDAFDAFEDQLDSAIELGSQLASARRHSEAKNTTEDDMAQVLKLTPQNTIPAHTSQESMPSQAADVMDFETWQRMQGSEARNDSTTAMMVGGGESRTLLSGSPDVGRHSFTSDGRRTSASQFSGPAASNVSAELSSREYNRPVAGNGWRTSVTQSISMETAVPIASQPSVPRPIFRQEDWEDDSTSVSRSVCQSRDFDVPGFTMSSQNLLARKPAQPDGNNMTSLLRDVSLACQRMESMNIFLRAIKGVIAAAFPSFVVARKPGL